MRQVISFLNRFAKTVLNKNFLKMGFIVVQWENENSVSIINEKKVVGAVELKELRS